MEKLTEKQVIETAQELIADCFALEASNVTPTTLLAEDLGADSLDKMDLLFGVQRNLGIEAYYNDDPALYDVRTVQDFYDLCIKLLRERMYL